MDRRDHITNKSDSEDKYHICFLTCRNHQVKTAEVGNEQQSLDKKGRGTSKDWAVPEVGKGRKVDGNTN